MPLRNLTNSPVDSPRLHRKTQFSLRSDLPIGSDESEAYIAPDIDDGICNAQRVISDQNSPFESGCGSGSDHATSTDVCHAVEQIGPQDTRAGEENCRLDHPVTTAKQSKHRRGWSLNDLDCLSDIQPPFREKLHPRSASSKEALESLANTTAYPHLPPRPPPHRRSTPDGIPPFGTLDAQRLRLVEPSWLHRLRDLMLGRPQHSDEDDHVVESTPQSTSTDLPPLTEVQLPRYHSPTELLRRASGMTRLVSVADTSVKSRRSSLPKGVRKASIPGDLATAADGSHVRGRFGQRVSGHGVGQRTIDAHPLARRHGTSAVEEEVFAINKACDCELQREQYQSSTGLPRGSFLQRSTRRDLVATGLSGTEPESSSRRLPLRVSEDQRQHVAAEMHGAIQISPLPSYVRSSRPIHHPLLSRTQNRRVSSSSRADHDVDHILSSESGMVYPPFMIEPAPYAACYPQPEISHGESMVPSTVEDIVERSEQDQSPAETDQTRNLKMEIEIC